MKIKSLEPLILAIVLRVKKTTPAKRTALTVKQKCWDRNSVQTQTHYTNNVILHDICCLIALHELRQPRPTWGFVHANCAEVLSKILKDTLERGVLSHAPYTSRGVTRGTEVEIVFGPVGNSAEHPAQIRISKYRCTNVMKTCTKLQASASLELQSAGLKSRQSQTLKFT